MGASTTTAAGGLLRRAGRRVLAMQAAVMLFACGGSGDSGASPTVPLATTPPVARGTLLESTWSAYPRLVRLAHQADSRRNGRIVVSVTENVGGVWQAGFHASDDDAASFARIGTLADASFATGLCCGTLFEMPQTVGAIDAGTLLYAPSVGADLPGALMAQPIYRSDDGGATFQRIAGASCGRSTVPRTIGAAGWGGWEPSSCWRATARSCLFSDETESGRSEVLKLMATSDGATWSVPEVIVAGPAASDRPGMAVVRKLPSGRYAMSFEVCSTARLDCSVHLKISDDGVHWGAIGTFGTRPQAVTGRYFRHAPTIAWSASASGARGTVALIGQIVATDLPGVDVSGNGRVLFVNADVESGASGASRRHRSAWRAPR